jgi:hypothetical protein
MAVDSWRYFSSFGVCRQGTASACQGGDCCGADPMGITHCPLCMALAVLCVVRATAHGTLLWRLAA